MNAYRRDFTAIASLVTDGNPVRMIVADITKESMRTAFAGYARDPASTLLAPVPHVLPASISAKGSTIGNLTTAGECPPFRSLSPLGGSS